MPQTIWLTYHWRMKYFPQRWFFYFNSVYSPVFAILLRLLLGQVLFCIWSRLPQNRSDFYRIELAKALAEK